MNIIGTLPVKNKPENIFSITILGELYSMRQLWNTIGFWTLDIMKNGTVLAYAVKMVSGITLLKQYPQIPFDIIMEENYDPGRSDLVDVSIKIIDKGV